MARTSLSEKESQKALQESAVPRPRNAHPAGCSGARPVMTTPTNQHAINAAIRGASAASSDASRRIEKTVRAGVSGQVTDHATTRRMGSSWQ